MNDLKRTVVAVLLRLYPARWRREFGAEFAGVLLRRRLGVLAVLDVIGGAFAQQWRTGEPWLLVGLPLLMLSLATIIRNILNPDTYAENSLDASLIQRLWFWIPSFTVGCWTVVRNPKKGGGGRAAAKSALLTGWPVAAIALLAGLGAIHIVTLGPGDLPGRFSEHGVAITLYDSLGRPTHLQPLFLLPFLNMPFAAFIGWLGGLMGRLWIRVEGRL